MNPGLFGQDAALPAVVVLWVVFLAAAGLFTVRARYLVRLLRLGGSEHRRGDLGRRLALVVTEVLGHRRLLREPFGLAHLAIFWGFVVYASAFGFTLLKGLVPSLPYPMPEEIAPVALALDVFGVVVLAAVVVAAVRRYVLRPSRLKQSRDAGIILTIIGSLMVTSLASRAADPASALALAMWWGHVLLVLAFLAYLPYSKHLHLLAAPFSVFLTDLGPRGRLRPAGALGDGALNAREFTWRELLNPFACAECGRCDRVCPSHLSGTALSPQKIVHHLKEHLLEAGPILLRGIPQDGHHRDLGGGIV
ncbi:MAG: hypothetical protein RB148_11570, partial [Armatimonadota bacterium]|nr:hypothetical protein [Armatimonadota bacterium]